MGPSPAVSFRELDSQDPCSRPHQYSDRLLVHCPESSRCHFGRLLTASFVARRRKTLGMTALRASLAIKTHPELATGTSRTVH